MRNANILTILRELVPPGSLTTIEALRLAEAQAHRLLHLSGVIEAPVSENIISDLPRIQVERVEPARAQAAAEWSHGRWLILLNGAMSRGRQRFSLAHEFKHILDHPFATAMYGSSDDCAVEQACDYFAACLLMPRRWLRQAWKEGVRDVPTLARRFAVSPQAIKMRLLQVGLIRPTSHYLAKEA
jgi:Zn-dependent peptidase ImmA (M78 family)